MGELTAWLVSDPKMSKDIPRTSTCRAWERSHVNRMREAVAQTRSVSFPTR